MRIDTVPPYSYLAPQIPASRPDTVLAAAQQGEGLSRPGVVVDISPEGWAANTRNKELEKVGAARESPLVEGPKECQTCKNRKYVDRSDDPSVSFQAPTNISPEQSAAAVLSHEYEHVSNEQARADKEGRRVISQTVTLETSICPECGRIYVSGGKTQTVTASDNRSDASVPSVPDNNNPA